MKPTYFRAVIVANLPDGAISTENLVFRETGKMAEALHERTVVVAMDGSHFAAYAFECKLEYFF